MCGMAPGGVICEIMNDDGSMARVPQLVEFCKRHSIKMISVASLIRYRLANERLVERREEGCLETEFGSFKTISYVSPINGEAHLALVRGDVRGKRERFSANACALPVGRCVRLHAMRMPKKLCALHSSASRRKAVACSCTCINPAWALVNITRRICTGISLLRRRKKPE